MTNDRLSEITAELARQDELLAEFDAALRSLGDCELAVPNATLEELEELTSPRAASPVMPHFALRV